MNARIYKEKTKLYHDRKILRKEFKVGDKVLLYKSSLYIMLGKLKSKWIGPFVVSNIFDYEVDGSSMPSSGMTN